MNNVEHILASKLLAISAIQLQPDNPFTWASGWSSPIYTDNRKTLSYPDIRTFIKIELCRTIQENFPDVNAIAGVATGAIAQGVLVADDLNLPYAYVRSEPKDHGLENLIEGNLRPGLKVVVIEDIVSSGNTSMKAVHAVRNAGCDVIGIVALFNYEFRMAAETFEKEGLKFFALCNYHAMLSTALEINHITPDDVEALRRWHRDPISWAPGR